MHVFVISFLSLALFVFREEKNLIFMHVFAITLCYKHAFHYVSFMGTKNEKGYYDEFFKNRLRQKRSEATTWKQIIRRWQALFE